MKALFVYSIEGGPSLRTPLHHFGQMQYGISYLSAALKGAGIATRLLVLSSESEELSLELAAETIRDYDPEVIGFTCVATQFPFIEKAARLAKGSWPDKRLIIGGPHVSLNPEEAARSVFDAVCIGEGEYPMLEWLQQLQAGREPEGIKNLWLKRADGSVQRNGTRSFNEKLDALPFPDTDMWLPWLKDKEGSYPGILLGRGCPYLCTYCCNHALRRLAGGKYVRFRSPGNIVQEIRQVLEKHRCETGLLGLEVETVGVYKEWTLELCRALQELNRSLPRPARFQTNFRITAKSLDPEIFRALAAANVGLINIGLESGSERVRREVLKRNYSNAEFFRAVELAREHGIEINIFNMMGIPGETPAEHFETVRLNREARPNRSYTSIFFPYQGTDLYKVCEERGLLTGHLDVHKERQKPALDLPEFPRRAVQRAYDLFDWRIHKGHWPLHVRARRLLDHYLGKSRLASRVKLRLLPAWKKLGEMGLINGSSGRRV